MAGLDEIVKRNAQALELYMRASPDATSFLDCFTKENDPAVWALYYLKPSAQPEDVCKAQACEAHIQRLFAYVKEHVGIDMDVTRPADSDTEGEVQLTADFKLDDPRLADAILDLITQINSKIGKPLLKTMLQDMSVLTGLGEDTTPYLPRR